MERHLRPWPAGGIIRDALPAGRPVAIKRTGRPYLVLHGNIRALLATKHHVNVFIYDPMSRTPPL